MIASVASTAPNVRPGPEDTAAAALQKQRLEATKQAQGQQTVAASSTEEAAAVVSISKQGADQATAKAAAPETATAAAAAATDEGLKSNKPALAYEAADTDQDGKISAFEQQSYDFRHPQLRAYDAVAQDGSADPNSNFTTPTDTSA